MEGTANNHIVHVKGERDQSCQFGKRKVPLSGQFFMQSQGGIKKGD